MNLDQNYEMLLVSIGLYESFTLPRLGECVDKIILSAVNFLKGLKTSVPSVPSVHSIRMSSFYFFSPTLRAKRTHKWIEIGKCDHMISLVCKVLNNVEIVFGCTEQMRKKLSFNLLVWMANGWRQTAYAVSPSRQYVHSGTLCPKSSYSNLFWQIIFDKTAFAWPFFYVHPFLPVLKIAIWRSTKAVIN